MAGGRSGDISEIAAVDEPGIWSHSGAWCSRLFPGTLIKLQELSNNKIFQESDLPLSD
jgi:hypothetical protein